MPGAWNTHLHEFPVPMAHHGSFRACREPYWLLQALVRCAIGVEGQEVKPHIKLYCTFTCLPVHLHALFGQSSMHILSMLGVLRVFLHFEAVNNACYVWVNGQQLGYSQDSCLPAEFEVTTVLQPGRNLLSVQVLLCNISQLVSNSLDLLGSWNAAGFVLVNAVCRCCVSAMGVTWRTWITGGSLASTGECSY